MDSRICVEIPLIRNIEVFYLVGEGEYPYECIAKDKHPHSLIYENKTGGWIASHQLTDTGNGYYTIH